MNPALKNTTTLPEDIDPIDPFGCAEMSVRLILAAALLCACVPLTLSQSGCTYTRNAPLFAAPIVDLDVKDSANGNTVPLVGQ